MKQIFSDMEGCNPILDRSLKFKSLTSGVFAPYDEMLKDVRQKARQTGSAQFLELLQEGKVLATSSESQTSEVELTDVSLSTSSSSAESVSPIDATCQASLSLNISWSLLTLIHCQWCHPICLSPLSALAVSLCPASFVLQGQTCLCTPGSLLTSYFCTPISDDEKDFLVLVPGLVGLHSHSASSALVVGV